MDKPIRKREHNDCQQLITKSMVDPDWIHILGKQRLLCVKGKVTAYVTCQCSENRCFWRVIDHKYQSQCCVAWCTVLFRSILTYHVSNKFSPGLCRKIMLTVQVITHFLRDNKADRIKQTTLFKVC